MFNIHYGFDPRDAACYGQDVNIFFPVGSGGRRPKNDPTDNSSEGRQRQVAEAFCNRCIVRTECRDLAAFYDSEVEGLAVTGVWGGSTEQDRRNDRVTVRVA